MPFLSEAPTQFLHLVAMQPPSLVRHAQAGSAGEVIADYRQFVEAQRHQVAEQRRLGPEAREMTWSWAAAEDWSGDISSFDKWIEEVENSIRTSGQDLANTAHFTQREFRWMRGRYDAVQLAVFRGLVEQCLRQWADLLEEKNSFALFLRAIRVEFGPQSSTLGTFSDPKTLEVEILKALR